jgi:hypothetical protein
MNNIYNFAGVAKFPEHSAIPLYSDWWELEIFSPRSA